MDHKAHVGFVDTHSEGIGRDHHALAVIYEVVLIADTLSILQARMIARRRDAMFIQLVTDLLHLFACGAVHNARPVAVTIELRKQRVELSLRPQHGKEQVWAVEARRHDGGLTQLQQVDDILSDRFGRSRGKRPDDRTARKQRDEPADIQIARAKILPPL